MRKMMGKSCVGEYRCRCLCLVSLGLGMCVASFCPPAVSLFLAALILVALGIFLLRQGRNR